MESGGTLDMAPLPDTGNFVLTIASHAGRTFTTTSPSNAADDSPGLSPSFAAAITRAREREHHAYPQHPERAAADNEAVQVADQQRVAMPGSGAGCDRSASRRNHYARCRRRSPGGRRWATPVRRWATPCPLRPSLRRYATDVV